MSTPFEPLPPVEPVTHTLLEVNEIVITPDIEKLAQNYDTLHDLPKEQTGDNDGLSLENASPTDSPQLEEILMSLPELTSDKVVKLQENNLFCKTILQHINRSKHENHLWDAIGILHKKVINCNNILSFVVVPQILIKYLLHASHDSLGHVGSTKSYHFLK